jgi:hypothetical protein
MPKVTPEKNPLPSTPPATKAEVVVAHLNNHRALYIWLPLGSLACFGALHLYYYLTGRAALDEVPVGAIWNILICNVVVIMVNCTKPLLFNDINTEDPKYSQWQIALDYLATFFLLFGFWYALTH